MAHLNSEEGYDIARDTHWTPRYGSEQALFPKALSDVLEMPIELLETFDEPYKVTYRDYVKTQREKNVGAYSVKAALARMSRVGRAPGMRNMATFGSLDEMRHAQVHLYFSFESLAKSRTFDDLEHTRAAIMTHFAFETAFINLQFIALSADTANCGDFSFATMLRSSRSGEARHAEIGEPLLTRMIDSGCKAEARKLSDISLWRCWKPFSALSGTWWRESECSQRWTRALVTLAQQQAPNKAAIATILARWQPPASADVPEFSAARQRVLIEGASS